MADPDAPLFHPRDIARGFALLTRLPAPGADATRGAAAAWTWPLVGLGVGALMALAGQAALLIGLPPLAAAFLALGTGIAATGALHEDGLADCADGFWGGATREKRLEIMRDSRIGSYGMLALLVTLGLQAALLADLFAAGLLLPALLVPAVLGRGAMALSMAGLAHARPDGLARHVGRPGRATALVAVALASGIAVLIGGPFAPAAIVAAAAGMVGVGALAIRKIGGQTGDVLGAVQVVSSLAALLALTAMAAQA